MCRNTALQTLKELIERINSQLSGVSTADIRKLAITAENVSIVRNKSKDDFQFDNGKAIITWEFDAIFGRTKKINFRDYILDSIKEWCRKETDEISYFIKLLVFKEGKELHFTSNIEGSTSLYLQVICYCLAQIKLSCERNLEIIIPLINSGKNSEFIITGRFTNPGFPEEPLIPVKRIDEKYEFLQKYYIKGKKGIKIFFCMPAENAREIEDYFQKGELTPDPQIECRGLDTFIDLIELINCNDKTDDKTDDNADGNSVKSIKRLLNRLMVIILILLGTGFVLASLLLIK